MIKTIELDESTVDELLDDLFNPWKGLVVGTEDRAHDVKAALKILAVAKRHKTDPTARMDAFAAINTIEHTIADQIDAIEEWKESTPDAKAKFMAMKKERVQNVLSFESNDDEDDETSDDTQGGIALPGMPKLKTLGDIIKHVFTPHLGVIPGTEERMAKLRAMSEILKDVPSLDAPEAERDAFMERAADMLRDMQKLCVEQATLVQHKAKADMIRQIMSLDPSDSTPVS